MTTITGNPFTELVTTVKRASDSAEKDLKKAWDTIKPFSDAPAVNKAVCRVNAYAPTAGAVGAGIGACIAGPVGASAGYEVGFIAGVKVAVEQTVAEDMIQKAGEAWDTIATGNLNINF